MNMKIVFLIIILSFLFAGSADAAEWELFAENNDQQYYLDKKSIEQYEITCSWCIRCALGTVDDCMRHLPKKFMRVWTRKIYKHPEKYQAKEELDFQEYACEKGMRRLLHETRIYSDGAGDSVNLNVLIKWEAIAPDTITELVHAYLCKKI
jgi:hypothetical protein